MKNYQKILSYFVTLFLIIINISYPVFAGYKWQEGDKVTAEKLNKTGLWDQNDDGTKLNFNGNVGIGITDPTEKLEVAGDIKANDVCTNDGKCLSSSGGNGDTTLVQDGIWKKNGEDKIYYDNGNVGIGTSTPPNKFTINQSGEAWNDGLRLSRNDKFWNITMSNNGTLWFGNQKEIDSNYSKFIINEDGKMGIGNNNPTMTFEVSRKSFYNGAAIGGSINDRWAYLYVDESGDKSIIWDDKTAMRFGTETAKGALGYKEHMRITKDGNIGIGTTNPGEHKLLVNGGDLAVAGGNGYFVLNPTDGGLEIASGNDNFSYIDFKGNDQLYKDYGGRLGYKSDTGFIFYGGNVGIGTSTPNVNYKLDVNGKLNATEVCINNNCKNAWPSGGSEEQNKATDTSIKEVISPSYVTGAVSLSCDGVGKIINAGVEFENRQTANTYTTLSDIEINYNGNTASGNCNGSNCKLHVICSAATGGTTEVKEVAADNIWARNTSDNTKIFYNDGNVGIGTNDPGTWKLAVMGNQYISGTTAVGGDLSVGGSFRTSVLSAEKLSDGTDGGILQLHNLSNHKFWHITERSGDNDKLMFWSNNANTTSDPWRNVLNMTMDGNVGIGTTDPLARLDIQHAGDVGDWQRGLRVLAPNLANGRHFEIGIGKTDSNKNMAEISYFHVADDSDQNRLNLGLFGNGEAVSILRNGNVGIGTNDPGTWKLAVMGTQYVSGNIETGDNMILGGSNQWIFHTPDDGRTSMYIAPWTGKDWGWGVMTFLQNGNVGIGTNDPVARLDVNGAISNGGSDFILGQRDGRNQGKVNYNRAFVHAPDGSDSLFINFGGDFEDGVHIQGARTVVDNEMLVTGGGGYFQTNPSDGGLELASGNDNYSFIDFKGKDNINSDYVGRFAFDDNYRTFNLENGSLLVNRYGDVGDWQRGLRVLAPNLANGRHFEIGIGKTDSNKNMAEISYFHVADDSDQNRLNLGLFGNGEAVSILRNGNVGIGTNDPGTWKLAVMGGQYVSGNIETGDNMILGGSNSWIFHTPNDGRTAMYIAPWTGKDWGWGVMTFLQNGNVGIGTNDPERLLHIKSVSNNDTVVRLNAPSAKPNSAIQLYGVANNGWTITNNGEFHGGNFLINYDDSADHVKFTALSINKDSGNVGIGTTDPSLGNKVGSKFTILSDNTGLVIGRNNGVPAFAINPQPDSSWIMYDYFGNGWHSGLVQKDGKVGIGTTDAKATLNVNGNISIRNANPIPITSDRNGDNNGGSISFPNGPINIRNTYASDAYQGPGLAIDIPSPGAFEVVKQGVGPIFVVKHDGTFHFGGAKTMEDSDFFISGGSDSVWGLFKNDAKANTRKMIINSSGNVGFETHVAIGMMESGEDFLLNVNGNSLGNSWEIRSDQRLKQNIQPIKSALEKVQNLNGVTFEWKKDGKKDIGFIAQDVGKVLPELVHTDSSKEQMKSLEYGNITAVLVEAMKEQQKQIESQKEENEFQQKEIEMLKEKINSLN